MPKTLTLRCIYVKKDKDIEYPEGFAIHHSSLIEPKGGKPYFAILLAEEEEKPEKNSAIGFDLTPSDAE